METYTTEEEQLEALRRWWQENGRSILLSIALAAVAVFGWQAWKQYDEQQSEGASDLYQAMLQAVAAANQSPAEQSTANRLAIELKEQYGGTHYGQFAALHLAGMAVQESDLAAAQAQLRWVLEAADSDSDIGRVARQRLARVLAAAGDTEQALQLLSDQAEGPYAGSYALARGDILLSLGRNEEARAAYQSALALAGQYPGQVNLASLEHKLQRLNPTPARTLAATPATSKEEQ